jgi:hypothetical protein
MRFWLIRKLAGRRAVMLNFRLLPGKKDAFVSSSAGVTANAVPRFRDSGSLVADCFFVGSRTPQP